METPPLVYAHHVQMAVDGLLAVKCNRLVALSPSAQRWAVLLYSLTGLRELTLYWVRLRQFQDWKKGGGLAVFFENTALDEWIRIWQSNEEVQEMLADQLHPVRQRIMLFIAEFEAHLEVDRLHRRGLRVPPTHIVATYLAALRDKAHSAAVSRHVGRLRSRAVTCKKWGRAFRRRWGHQWGAGHATHGVTDSDVSKRSGVFLRWVYWVHRRLSQGGVSPIVVNMDETMLSSVKPLKLGVVPDSAKLRQISLGHVGRDAPLPRTSLIAAVCSDAALQKVLPQMRLPKTSSGAIAGRRARQVYAESGRPQCTLHGTGGWNTSATLTVWLRELATQLRRAAPDRPVLLVMDACCVHLSATVLRKCAALGVAVAIIPSRMTWMLQPLDTHVFACLKRDIRKRCFGEIATSPSSVLSPCKRIRIQGDAIRSVLVERDWSTVVARSGLAGPGAELRDTVKNHVGNADLSPRVPTAEELHSVLNVPFVRCEHLREMLLTTVEAAYARAAAAAAGAAAAAPDSAPPGVGVPGSGRAVPMPSLRLGRSARLPPTRPRSDMASQFLFVPPESGRPVTRSMSASHFAVGTSVANAASSAPASSSWQRRGQLPR